jgi:hypothetical protein
MDGIEAETISEGIAANAEYGISCRSWEKLFD